MSMGVTTSKEVEKQVCEDYANNFTYKQIVSRNNISEPLIPKILRRNNIKLTGFKTIKVNENFFETIDTPAKAYYLAFIAGDGYLRYREKLNSYSLRIELHSKDVDILEKFKNDLESDHKINLTKRWDQKYEMWREPCYIEISNTKLCKDVIKNGIKIEKSKDLSIPSCISDQLMPHFIRGLSDSDGGWHVRPNKNEIIWSFASSLSSFSEEVKQILIEKCNLDFIPSYANSTNTCWSFSYGGNVQCKRIYDYLYSGGGPWLDRKYKLSTDHFNNNGGTVFSNMSNIRKLKMEHSYSKYVHGICKCDICKLCNNIYCKYRTHGIHLLTTFVTDLSIKHLDLYKTDPTYKKNIFYSKIDEEIEIYKSTQNIETDTNFDSKYFKSKKDTIISKPKEISFLNQLLGFKS